MTLKSIYTHYIRPFKKKSELVAEIDLLIPDNRSEALAKCKEIAQLLPKERGALHKLLGLAKEFPLEDPIMCAIEDHIVAIDKAIRSQQMQLRFTHLQSLVHPNIRHRYKKFRETYEVQLHAHKRFRTFLTKKLKPLETNVEIKKLRKEENLYISFFKELGSLFRIKDIHKLQKKAVELLNVTEQLKGTLLYSYMDKDIKRIQKKLKYIRDHPEKSRLQYLLAGAYIVSPGTFEITFVYLVIRYIGKYMTDDKSPVKQSYKTILNTLRHDRNKYI